VKRPAPLKDARNRRQWYRPIRMVTSGETGRRLAFIIGIVVVATGVAMLPAAAVGAIYEEWDEAARIAAAGLITILVGAVAALVGARGELSVREGFAAVGLSWFAMAAVGTLPYLLTGAIPTVTDAFFETASGFTTTGSSIVADPGSLSHGILIWRAATQWLGGMGVIVLSVAILPLLGVGGMQLTRAEAPGPEPDRLTPRFRETARRLWLLYAALTAVLAGLLAAGEMTVFEAVAHAFTTMSTGGFGTDAASIGAFGAYTQWVIIVFMFLAGVSFTLHFRALRQPSAYARHSEFRLYAGICLAAVAVAIYASWGEGGAEESVRAGAFTAISLVTTTGYTTTDFAQWAAGLQIFAVALMFLGGMAGSTAGSIKTFRHGVLTHASFGDVRRLVNPRGVFLARLGRQPVPDHVVAGIRSFFLFYMFIFATGAVVFGIVESQFGAQADIVTSVSAVASAMGNIGPGLGEVGPTGDYASVSAAGKWLLAFLMIVGRLEIFPVLLLFTRTLWRP
jgi:trk system potassium uptake protein